MSSPMPEFICPSSLLPFGAHDEDVLRLLALPVTSAMIRHVSAKLLAAVGAPGQQHLLPTPPVTPIRGKFALGNVTCGPEWEFPPLEVFLTRLVMSSDIHTSSVLSSMIYLKRIMKSLESDRASAFIYPIHLGMILTWYPQSMALKHHIVSLLHSSQLRANTISMFHLPTSS